MNTKEMWIQVINVNTGRRVAINLSHVITIRENDKEAIFNGRRTSIDFTDGTILETAEDFDKICSMKCGE